MKSILLTGGTGFVGSFLIEELLKQDYNIIALKRSSSSYKNIPDVVLNSPKLVFFDISTNDLEDVFKNYKIDAIIHVATAYGRKGEKPSEIITSTFLFPLQLLEYALKYNIEIFLNTDSYFNSVIKLFDPILGYHSEGKKIYLQYAKKLITDKKIKFVNLFIGHIYGPRDDVNKLIPSVICKINNHVKQIDFTKGEQERNFVYVKDLVSIYLVLLKNSDQLIYGYQDFEGWTGEKHTVRQMLETIKKMMHSDIVFNFGALEYRPDEMMILPITKEKLHDFGWEPQYNLESGIYETIQYFTT